MKKRYFAALITTGYIFAHHFIIAENLKIAEGNRIIEKINNFKIKHGKFPDDLEAVGAGQDIYYGPFWYTNKGGYFVRPQ